MGLCMPRLQALRCTLKLSDDRWADNGPFHFPPRLTTLDITLTTEADDERAIQQFNEIVESLSHVSTLQQVIIICDNPAALDYTPFIRGRVQLRGNFLLFF